MVRHAVAIRDDHPAARAEPHGGAAVRRGFHAGGPLRGVRPSGNRGGMGAGEPLPLLQHRIQAAGLDAGGHIRRRLRQHHRTAGAAASGDDGDPRRDHPCHAPQHGDRVRAAPRRPAIPAKGHPDPRHVDRVCGRRRQPGVDCGGHGPLRPPVAQPRSRGQRAHRVAVDVRPDDLTRDFDGGGRQLPARVQLLPRNNFPPSRRASLHRARREHRWFSLHHDHGPDRRAGGGDDVQRFGCQHVPAGAARAPVCRRRCRWC